MLFYHSFFLLKRLLGSYDRFGNNQDDYISYSLFGEVYGCSHNFDYYFFGFVKKEAHYEKNRSSYQTI